MYYYKVQNNPAFSLEIVEGFEIITEENCQELLKDEKNTLLFLTKTDVDKRTSFALTDPMMMFQDPDDLEFIRESKTDDARLQDIPNWILDQIKNKRVRYLNMANESFLNILSIPKKGKWRVNIVGLGDVGSNLLVGLKLLGGDYISEIGVYSTKPNVMQRYEMELNQVYSIDEDSPLSTRKPMVKVVEKEKVMDCDMFIFCASSRISAFDATMNHDNTQQFTANKEILRKYINKARNTHFKGVFAIVSDPVEPLCKAAYLMSNTDEEGNLDYKGLLPEQIQGFGLGLMYARALYYAEKNNLATNFRKNGRVYGVHGKGLVVADDIENYNEEKSDELAEMSIDSRMMVRELGFKPYIAPALSSGAIPIIDRIAGKYSYNSIYIDGVYFGIKNRAILSGIEIERIKMNDTLFNKAKHTHDMLKNF